MVYIKISLCMRCCLNAGLVYFFNLVFKKIIFFKYITRRCTFKTRILGVINSIVILIINYYQKLTKFKVIGYILKLFTTSLSLHKTTTFCLLAIVANNAKTN